MKLALTIIGVVVAVVVIVVVAAVFLWFAKGVV